MYDLQGHNGRPHAERKGQQQRRFISQTAEVATARSYYLSIQQLWFHFLRPYNTLPNHWCIYFYLSPSTFLEIHCERACVEPLILGRQVMEFMDDSRKASDRVYGWAFLTTKVLVPTCWTLCLDLASMVIGHIIFHSDNLKFNFVDCYFLWSLACFVQFLWLVVEKPLILDKK